MPFDNAINFWKLSKIKASVFWKKNKNQQYSKILKLSLEMKKRGYGKRFRFLSEKGSFICVTYHIPAVKENYSDIKFTLGNCLEVQASIDTFTTMSRKKRTKFNVLNKNLLLSSQTYDLHHRGFKNLILNTFYTEDTCNYGILSFSKFLEFKVR